MDCTFTCLRTENLLTLLTASSAWRASVSYFRNPRQFGRSSSISNHCRCMSISFLHTRCGSMLLLLLSILDLHFLESRNSHVLDRAGEGVHYGCAQTGCQSSFHRLQYSIHLASHERLQALHSSSYLYGVLTLSCYLCARVEFFVRLLVPGYAITL